MPTRRELLKGSGGAVLVGLAGSAAGADAAGRRRPPVRANRRRRRRHRHPPLSWVPAGWARALYWSTYDYENVSNTIIPEAVWKTNIDWVAETFRDYGYTMACTDGWIDDTQKVTSTATSSARRTTGSTTGLGGPTT